MSASIASSIGRVELGAAARAGVDIVQIRERDLEARDLTASGRATVSAAARGTSPRIIVNERADVAAGRGRARRALRGDSIDALTRPRACFRPTFIVGRSVHGVEERGCRAIGGLDYLILGTMFRHSSKHCRTSADADDWHLAAACASVTDARAGDRWHHGRAGRGCRQKRRRRASRRSGFSCRPPGSG